MLSCSSEDFQMSTDSLSLAVNDHGNITSIKANLIDTEFLAANQKAPLLLIWKTDSILLSPISMSADGTLLSLSYEDGIVVQIQVIEKKTHLSFEIVSATPQEKIPAVIWGPYPIDIGETVGEVVGVTRNQDFAIGLQALNLKTIGGFPLNDAGGIENRKGAASKTDFGSTLQAFSFDRSIERHATVWGTHYANMPIPPIEGETVVGSKIALFGSTPDKALETIGKIELDEGLPHPMVGGEWIKTHPERSKAYFITSFNEENFEKMLAYTKKAGMNAIYHSHPFKNWGQFDLIPGQFPNGNPGMKALVEKAKKQGVRVGVHTLTTFITPNDQFITPIPNKDLALTGSGKLSAAIDATTQEIPVNTDEYFNNETANWMHTVKIGDELIRYRTVSKETPYKLLDCERGAFGTTASAHESGAKVGKLMDHGYKVFFPNFKLQKEMAQNMVDFFNETGVTQMDFDGHEGALATGQGTYGMDVFADQVFRNTKLNLVNGSSRITHYYWHINHYINWGEPWYAGFRQSQSEYRFNNQPFLEENYLPNMLGWFSLTATTTVEDIEWMLARGAGYHAGFALFSNSKSLANNPNTDKMLDLIRIWEKARLSGAFSDEQRKLLKDLSKEFHLEEISDSEWKLMMFQDYNFAFEKTEVQPGQPTYAEWKFDNDTGEQPFRSIISLEGKGAISNISIEVSNYAVINIPEELSEGQILTIDARGLMVITDEKGIKVAERKLTKLPLVGEGTHSIQFDCKVDDGNPKVMVKVRLDGKSETVRSQK